jgi:hypothetical protein
MRWVPCSGNRIAAVLYMGGVAQDYTDDHEMAYISSAYMHLTTISYTRSLGLSSSAGIRLRRPEQ